MTQWNLHIIPVVLNVSISIVELKTAMNQKAFIPFVLTVKLMANSIFSKVKSSSSQAKVSSKCSSLVPRVPSSPSSVSLVS